MLTSVRAPLCGNAVLLAVIAAQGADYVSVYRRPDATFTGTPPAGAVLVYQGEGDFVPDLDKALQNGTPYYYRSYSHVNGNLVADEDPIAVTPAATYVNFGPDVRGTLRDRLDLGYQQEIARDLLKLKDKAGGAVTKIPVVTAPPDVKTTAWPITSVKIMLDDPQDRSVGEQEVDGTETPNETAHDLFTVQITAWSQNPDERHALHEATRRIVMANLPVFEAMGLVKITWRTEDIDYLDGQLFDGLVYSSVMTLTCEAPVGVIAQDQSTIVAEVDPTITPAPIISGVAQVDTGT